MGKGKNIEFWNNYYIKRAAQKYLVYGCIIIILFKYKKILSLLLR
jgi:hypothetical protein